jgi:hypothetical protein
VPQLFRFDFMIDDHALPILTEVNISPNLVAAHPEDGKVKSALLRDLLRLVTARFRPTAAAPPKWAFWRLAEAAAAADFEAAERAAAGGFRRIPLPRAPAPPDTGLQ